MHTRDYRLLAHFAAIAEAGSIRAAARRLRLSPAVVSTSLADLEAAFAATLVRRGRRPLALTAAGQRLFEAAAEMVAAGERAMAQADARRPGAEGPLAITLTTELSVAWLPPLLRAFERRHTGVHVVIHALDAPVDLARSDFDIAIRARYMLGGPRPAGTLAVLPLALVAAPGPHLRQKTLAARLANLPLIGFTLHPGDDVVVALDPEGRRIELPVRTRCYVNDGLVAKEMAKAGLGAALVIALAAADELRRGTLVSVDTRYRFGAVALRLLLRDRLPSPAARAFAEFVRAWARAPA